MQFALLIDPISKVVLAENAEHVLNPWLSLFRDLIKVREVIMNVRPINYELQKIFHIKTFDLGTECFLDLVVLDVLLPPLADVIEEVPISIISRQFYPDTFS